MISALALRHLIPLMFFSTGLALIVTFYIFGYPAAEKEAERFAILQTQTSLESLQGRLNQHLYRHDPYLIGLEIFFHAANPKTKASFIVTTDGQIRYAHRSRFIGENIASLNFRLDKQLVRQVAEEGKVLSLRYPGSEKFTVGYAGLAINDQPVVQGTSAVSDGMPLVLVVLEDFEPVSESILSIASQPSEMLATLMIIVTFLLAWLMRQKLRNRLLPLLEAAKNLSSGKEGVRTELRGQDEFAEMSCAFDHMAAQIDAYRRHLADALESAKNTNDAQNTFLKSVSHEIRTPLATILGFLELLKSSDINEAERIYATTAENAGQALLGMINDIVDVTRSSSYEKAVQIEPVWLMKLINAIVELMREKASAKGLYLKCEIDHNPDLWIESDPYILRRVLINLIINAINHTTEGSITLNVSAVMSEGQSVDLSLKVTDTGGSIQPELRQIVFDADYQSQKSIRQSPARSSVGLGAVKDLVELLGGTIGVVDSNEGEASFEIKLNVEKCEARDTEELASITRRQQMSQQILVVDDNPANQMLITSILTKWGHQVITAESGFEAIDILKKRLIYPDLSPIDVVLMDIHMPGMDGFETTRAIRGLDSRYKTLPILALTADISQKVLSVYRERMMDGIIEKPINTAHLAAEIFRTTQLKSKTDSDMQTV